jgi:hypothetical protein
MTAPVGTPLTPKETKREFFVAVRTTGEGQRWNQTGHEKSNAALSGSSNVLSDPMVSFEPEL